jgi:FkbM family methyltransferase
MPHSSHLTNALFAGLRLYTRFIPFHRGRGAFIWPIQVLKRKGWPAPLMTTPWGAYMEFEPSLVGWTIFERGVWEPQQTALIAGLLHEGGMVLNVGANTGYYALLAASVIGPSGHVHAFEMQPAMVEILRRNVARNGLEPTISIVETACWSTEGEAVIASRGDPGAARLSFTQAVQPRVALTTLDRYAAKTGLSSVDMILVDTEGADFEVLKGAAGILRRFHPTVIAEIDHLGAFGGSEEKLRAYMAEFGYVSHILKNDFSHDALFQGHGVRQRANTSENSPNTP